MTLLSPVTRGKKEEGRKEVPTPASDRKNGPVCLKFGGCPFGVGQVS